MKGEECQICGEHVVEMSYGPNHLFRLDNPDAYTKAAKLSGANRWWICWTCWDGMAEQIIGEGL